MCGTLHSVSTLLTTVGLPHRPAICGNGGFARGCGAPALERVDERGLLAGDVAAGAGVHEQLEAPGRAEHMGAEIARGLGLGDGPLQALGGQHVLAAQKNVAAARLDRIARDDHGLDQLMRGAFHEQAILEGAGLHLIGIADQVLLPRRILAHRHEAPLDAGRESRRRRGREGWPSFTRRVTSAGCISLSALRTPRSRPARLVARRSSGVPRLTR